MWIDDISVSRLPRDQLHRRSYTSRRKSNVSKDSSILRSKLSSRDAMETFSIFESGNRNDRGVNRELHTGACNNSNRSIMLQPYNIPTPARGI